MFPGRLELVLGDSSVTVPAYAAAEAAAGRDPQACSVVFVDGSHSEEGAYADLVNFRAMTSKYVPYSIVRDILTRGQSGN